MTKKKIPEETKSILLGVQGILDSISEDQKAIQQEIEADNEALVELFSRIPSWVGFYSISYQALAAILCCVLGYEEQLRSITSAKEKRQVNMDVFRDLIERSETEEIFEELNELESDEQMVFSSLFLAMWKNLEALQSYNLSMCQLVERAKKDDEALFAAVCVDRSVVAHPVIAARILRAELCQDNPFMDSLAKSITKTKPRRDYQLDDTRLLLEMLDEIEGLESISNEEIANYLVNEREVYSADGKDPEAAIAKMILRIRKKRQT